MHFHTEKKRTSHTDQCNLDEIYGSERRVLSHSYPQGI